MAGNTPRLSSSFAALPFRSGHAARYRRARSAATARGSWEWGALTTSATAAAAAAASESALEVATGPLPLPPPSDNAAESWGRGQDRNWESVTDVSELESG